MDTKSITFTQEQDFGEVVSVFNQIPGIVSLFTQNGGQFGVSQIRFGGYNSLQILPRIAREIMKEQKKWKVEAQADPFAGAHKRRMSLSLTVDDAGILLKWNGWDFHRVVTLIDDLLIGVL